jgi:hypothetical protein
MRKSEFHYEMLLKHVAIPAVSNQTTFGTDLEKYGRIFFGKRFHGVYMADQIPTNINKRRPYAIINLDRSSDPGDGSHWIAVSHTSEGLLVYDSFGQLHDTPEELIRLYGKATVLNKMCPKPIVERVSLPG